MIDLDQIAKKLSTRVQYKRYRMWHGVPHIFDTALAVDETVSGGGQAIITIPRQYPMAVTEDFIVNAIQHKAISLGSINSGRRRMEFIPWNEREKKYPSGYFTHQIGPDVSGL